MWVAAAIRSVVAMLLRLRLVCMLGDAGTVPGDAAQAPLERAVRRVRRGGDDRRQARGHRRLEDRHGRGAARPGPAVTTRADRLVDLGADKLEELATKLSAHGEWGELIAEDLVIDADFLRKLKPSLILARARGQAPTNGRPPEAPT